MLRSLFSGISGLRSHQLMLDVTSNNIANVNTMGFKSSSVLFQDTLSQLVTGSSAPAAGNGGTNPSQVGLGVRTDAVTTNFAQGSAQVTGKNTDMMINGDGFFVVKNKGEQMYSRNGAFTFDADGRLVNNSGMVMQGWGVDDNGLVDTKLVPDDVVLPISTLFQPKTTTEAYFGGNLPSDAAPGTEITTSIRTYDLLGTERTVSVTFTRGALPGNSWTVAAFDEDAPTANEITDPLNRPVIDLGADGSGPPDLDNDGNPDPFLVPVTSVAGKPGDPYSFTIDLTKITGYSGQNTVAPSSQNGYSMGSLSSFSISKDGMVVGVFSNGLKRTLAQLALANFNNPPGLEKAGESVYRSTVNSGEPRLGTPGSGSRGFLQGQALEMSNVDLGQEFTNLVVAQRGFQANSKIITTSDELLQELVNMKR
jgi:flagellar hook protein FlgE